MTGHDLVRYHGELAAEWAKDGEAPKVAARHAAFHASAARLCAVLQARAAALQRVSEALVECREGRLTEEEFACEVEAAFDELAEAVGS